MNLKQWTLNRIRSFQHAFRGIQSTWRSEFHFRFHVLIALLALGLGFLFELKNWEWCVVLICIGAVMSFECANAALEKLCDHINPEIHPTIKMVKDMAAAGVLISSITALICGLIIFVPHINQ